MGDNIKFEVIKKVSDVYFKYRDFGNLSKLNSNSPPSVFIGSKLKYPLVNVGILSPIEKDDNAWIYDDAKFWAENDFGIHDIVKLRDGLVNSRFQSNVHSINCNNNFVELAQQLALSMKPVDIEIELKNKINIGRKKDRVLTPHGMNVNLKSAKIVENVKVDRLVDKVINDDIKSEEGVHYLYTNNFNEYVLSKILSVGVLGLKTDKKLVPTRWAITATDDMIGKRLINNIKECNWIENYELFFGSFLGNHYLIMLFPNIYSYELFEIYLPLSFWNSTTQIKASTDFENSEGRKSYATNTAGGYYAARLPILEYLNKIQKQASVIAIRIESPSYWASLGVWVVRESVRKTLQNKKLDFNSINEVIDSCRKIGMIKFGFDTKKFFDQSKILDTIMKQKTLKNWFS